MFDFMEKEELKKKIWIGCMTVILFALIIISFIIKPEMEIKTAITAGIILGITFVGMDYHFKNISSYKGFKIFQFIFMVSLFVYSIVLMICSENAENMTGIILFAVFFSTKDLTEYILDGITIINKEPKKKTEK